MKEKEHAREELKKLSPFLADLEKGQPFNVPKDYFKKLPGEVLEKAGLNEEHEKKSTPARPLSAQLEQFLQQLFRPAVGFSLAAVLLLIAVGLSIWNRDVDPSLSSPDAEAIFASISTEEAYQYALEHLDEIDQELILDTYQQELEDGDYINIPVQEENFDKEFLDEYLDDVDIEQLEEWL